MGKFVIKYTKAGVKFDLKATNGQIILSSETYKKLVSAQRGVASVAKNAPIAGVEDKTAEDAAPVKCPKFEYYVDKAGEYRFRLKATNGQIIGVSEGYVKLESCLNGIESVKKNAVNAPVEILPKE